VREKRLFWISIIIVELVMLYVVWRPLRSRFTRPSHRVAQTRPVVQPHETKPLVQQPAASSLAGQTEHKPPAIVIGSLSLRGTHPNLPLAKRPPVVNAALKAPEPIPATTGTVVVPLASTARPTSFWCDLAMIASPCDCKTAHEERANNLLP
jgi:hypothetical protein